MLTLLLGGTFDPVHAGHLALARRAAQAFSADVHLLPSAQPPHRAAPRASAAQRLAMLRLAVAAEPRLRVDARELARSGPSYTVDTLRELRGELGSDAPLGLLLGGDAFLGLPAWHEWSALPRLAHLVVVTRPGSRLDALPPPLQAELRGRWTSDPHRLPRQAAGLVHQLQMQPDASSATAVRAALARGETPAALAPAVAEYIRQQGLYRAP